MSGATRRGIVAGIVAAATVAVFFLIVDLVGGQMLRTPAFLAGLVTGAETAAGDVRLATVAMYTVLHFAVFIGVGGSLDVWSGVRRRAPAWMRRVNLEWLYRITMEPHRIRRIYKTLPLFVVKVLFSKV